MQEAGEDTNFVDCCSRSHPRREDNRGCHRILRTLIYRCYCHYIWMPAPDSEDRCTPHQSHRRNRRGRRRRRTSWCSFRTSGTGRCQARSRSAVRYNCRSSGNCSRTRRRCIATSDRPYGTPDRRCMPVLDWRPSLSCSRDGLSLLALKGRRSQIDLWLVENRDTVTLIRQFSTTL